MTKSEPAENTPEYLRVPVSSAFLTHDVFNNYILFNNSTIIFYPCSRKSINQWQKPLHCSIYRFPLVYTGPCILKNVHCESLLDLKFLFYISYCHTIHFGDNIHFSFILLKVNPWFSSLNQLMSCSVSQRNSPSSRWGQVWAPPSPHSSDTPESRSRCRPQLEQWRWLGLQTGQWQHEGQSSWALWCLNRMKLVSVINRWDQN